MQRLNKIVWPEIARLAKEEIDKLVEGMISWLFLSLERIGLKWFAAIRNMIVENVSVAEDCKKITTNKVIIC